MRLFALIFAALTSDCANVFVDADKYICRCERFAFQNKPFVAIWNSPTNGCDFNFSTPINLKRFGIIENDHQTWDGRHVTVFASAQLGLYPYFVLNGEKNYNGGLPQSVDLGQHLRKARKDIEFKIPDPNYDGLAVIDWEQWRPLWDTNWDPKKIYKVKSVELVRYKHPDWTLGRLIEEAKKEFEEAARALFEHTITMGKELRPKAFWGFYGFPDCYGNEKDNYQCIAKTKKQNDQLEWLFSASSALFPSMYLQNKKTGNHNFVLGRLRETLRFAAKGFGQNRRNIPIFVYHRNIYEEDEHAYNFLEKDDLDNTIAVSADLGTAGVVIWGNRFDENTSPEVCRKIENYVYSTLGPYLQTKFKEVEQCASTTCHSHGHCIDKALLTSGLLRRYESEPGSSQYCSPVLTSAATPARQLSAVRSEIPNHHNRVAATVSPNMLQTLRDRNRDINEAFQASQNGLSRKMGEFFEMIYANTSIANSTGLHNFKSAKIGVLQNNRIHDFSNLENFREKEFVQRDGPPPKTNEDQAHPSMNLNTHHTVAEVNTNNVAPLPFENVNNHETLVPSNGMKPESSVVSHLPYPDSIKLPRRTEPAKSLHGSISVAQTPLHGENAKPKPPTKIHEVNLKLVETLHTKKPEPMKHRNSSKLQQTTVATKPGDLFTLKERKAKPPTVNKKPAGSSSTIHIIKPKPQQPLNTKYKGKPEITDHPHVNHTKHVESASLHTTKKPHQQNASNPELSRKHLGNKSDNSVKPDSLKTTHIDTLKTHTEAIKKSDKSAMLNINKGDSSSAANVRKSDIPKLPQKEKSQVAMALVLGTQAEQRSSLEVAGQLAKMDKNMDGVRSSHYAVQGHNGTEDVKARRKSVILQSDKLGTGKATTNIGIPHMYLILIGTSIAGALMFALMSVAAYYYVNLRHSFAKRKRGHLENDASHSTSYSTPDAHSSPILNAGNYKGISSTVSEIKQFFDLIQKRRENNKVGTQTSDEIELSNQTGGKTSIVIDDVKKSESRSEGESVDSLTVSKSIDKSSDDDGANVLAVNKKASISHIKLTKKSPNPKWEKTTSKHKGVNRSRDNDRGRTSADSRKNHELNDAIANNTSNNKKDQCACETEGKGRIMGYRSEQESNSLKQVESERNKKKRYSIHSRYHFKNANKTKTKKPNNVSTSSGDLSSRSSEGLVRKGKSQVEGRETSRNQRSTSSYRENADRSSNNKLHEKKARSSHKIASPIKSIETKQDYTSVDMDKRNTRSCSSPKKNLSFTDRFNPSKRRKNKREFWSDGDDHGDEFEIDLNHMY